MWVLPRTSFPTPALGSSSPSRCWGKSLQKQTKCHNLCTTSFDFSHTYHRPSQAKEKVLPLYIQTLGEVSAAQYHIYQQLLEFQVYLLRLIWNDKLHLLIHFSGWKNSKYNTHKKKGKQKYFCNLTLSI